MKNLLQRLAHWLRSLFRRSKPVEFAPRLSREKEDAVVRFFDAHAAYLNDPSYANHVEVFKAHLASREAKQYAPRQENPAKEGLDAIYPNEEA